MRITKNKFRVKSKPVARSISNKLDRSIKKIQKELQMDENIKFGRKAQVVTYTFASAELTRRLDK